MYLSSLKVIPSQVGTRTFQRPYACNYEEMVDFSKSNKIIKISEKVDTPNTCIEFSSNISFFIQGSLKKFS